MSPPTPTKLGSVEPISPEAQQILDRIDEQTLEAIRRGEAAERVQTQVTQLRQQASSRDHEITVEVDSEGHLTDITFETSALGLGTSELARLILDTISQARIQVSQRVVEIAMEEFGQDSPLADIFRNHYAE